MAQLLSQLCYDLHQVGLLPINPTCGRPDVKVILRPYSKTYFGRFVSKSNKIFVYAYKDKEMTTLYSYSKLLCTAIHEGVHAKQHNDPKFLRAKGIMHNQEFYDLYNYYVTRAISLRLIDKEEQE